MAKLPNEVRLEINTLTHQGLGEAVVHDEVNQVSRTYHVRNALPGEIVDARILRRRKGKRQADGVLVDAASIDRQPSACEYFPRCGGCSMHHLQIDAQLALKQKQLADALAEHGVVPQVWQPPQAADQLGYRRKARLGVRRVGEHVFVGFRESFSNRVARIDHCPVLTPALSALIAPLKNVIAQLSIADKIPQIEMAQGDRSCVLMVRHLEPMNDDDLRLWEAFEQRHDVTILLQSGGYDTLKPLSGGEVGMLGYQLARWGLHMHFAPQQFTQVNLLMNRVLIQTALSYLGDLRQQRVVDLFCGIGNFTLPLVRAGADVWGFEADDSAIEMAKHNAQLNALAKKTHFATMDLYTENAKQVLPQNLDAMLLDPPRSGAGPNLSHWLDQFAGHTIVYVSCNPVSFAEDAKVMTAAGFKLRSVGIFNMFPHTAHIETVGHFVRAANHG